ncbi:Hypothetical protein SRAE_X000206300 [Strongyloides ratti]|uniref:Uncharacterized protein n=1 Tax=Strongyloides ratti TaxID=34506 RepID=A0A090KS36_STRRB|nr:Hypothetical protein SRAE_X000206300 [Strongyloides ratti]CEF60325.1 Hypothetical protein SRAE_X000206300 [Strongyloides ratti]
MGNELLLLAKNDENNFPKNFEKYNENKRINFPYKINDNIQLDINFKAFNEIENKTNIPTLWSFMDENGSEERKKLIEEEIEDPFKMNKK